MTMTTSVSTADVTASLLDEVERIAPIIKARAAGAAANRRLATAGYAAMFEARLFAMLQPRAHGGLELHPVEAMKVWEAVARIDPSAAWNLVMNQAIATAAGWLTEDAAREVLRDGPT